MLEITSNTSVVITQLVEQIGLALDSDKMLRTVATSMTGVMRKRVHEDGLNANGTPIGTYDKKYLEQRQKPPYNRTASNKKVVSLTRQMENDMKPLPTALGWGIGYSNDFNYQKALHQEQLENVKILTALTPDEDKLAGAIADDYVNEILKQI